MFPSQTLGYHRAPMPDRPRYYLTTAIAYANSKPGVHTLYEVIGADVIARWHRMIGDDTRFLTGTDEHSINIAQAAVDEGRPAREFVDEKVALFKEAEDALGISPDRFIRTTDPDHIRAEQEMVRRAHENGESAQREDGSWDPEAGIIYVWYDALINYITGAGFPDDMGSFERWWPADLHVIGKDIARFHTIFWPAMLWSAGLEAPRHVWVHGWLMAAGGERMSKSRGNFLDPTDFVSAFGSDGARYVVLREVPFDRDAEVSWDSFVRRYNADLANDFGNLVNRTVSMTRRYLEGVRPAPRAEAMSPLAEGWNERVRSYAEALEGCRLHDALAELWEFVGGANRVVDAEKPWDLAKAWKAGDEAAGDRLRGVLGDLVE